MLDLSIDDPCGFESFGAARSAAGLGMLPIHTVMNPEKTVRRVAGKTHSLGESSFTGYEIHMGETAYGKTGAPFAEIIREGDDERADGAADASGQIWGTYVHGISMMTLSAMDL